MNRTSPRSPPLSQRESVESTQIYLFHADLTIKQRAREIAAPLGTRTGRYRPPDALLAFLDEPCDYAEERGLSDRLTSTNDDLHR